jgi:hypothetical protein
MRQDPIGSAGTSRQRQSDSRGPLARDTTAFPPLSPARNFLPLSFLPPFPAAVSRRGAGFPPVGSYK